jgi:hypothetical protein
MQFQIYLLNQFFIKLNLSLPMLLLSGLAYRLLPDYFLLGLLLFTQLKVLLFSQPLILLFSFPFSFYFLRFGQLMNHLIFIIISHLNLGFHF